MNPRNYYVFARQNPEEPFQPVSYNRKKGLINLGLLSMTDLREFALTKTNALRAGKYLMKNRYEVALVEYVPGKSGIDLDEIVSEEKTFKNFKKVLKAHNVISTEKSR